MLIGQNETTGKTKNSWKYESRIRKSGYFFLFIKFDVLKEYHYKASAW